MRVLQLAILLIALGAPVAAAAQTAEEAIAYVFMGLADGAKLERGKSLMTWKETSSSPATYEGVWTINGHVNNISFAVSATNDCDYVVRIAGPPTIVPHGTSLYARVELKKVTGVAPLADAERIGVTGDGYCETSPGNEDCRPTDTSDLFGAVEAARHQELVAFIRTKVCLRQYGNSSDYASPMPVSRWNMIRSSEGIAALPAI